MIVDLRLNWKFNISMIYENKSKSCGIIYIKSKRVIYHSLIFPYLTYCVNVWSSTYRTNLKIVFTSKKRSVRVVSATAQQPYSRDIFSNQKFSLLINWLINKKEYLPLKWSMAHTCLVTFSLTDMTCIITNIETMKI